LVGAQPELVDWHDAWVLELTTDLRLLDEARDQLRIAQVLLAPP
jgi:hypothetical protein